jgi:hypothetical protein
MNKPEEKDKGLVLKEYGRNTQRLVDYILTIPDKAKRTELSKILIELMRQLSPAAKDGTDQTQRFWDHLYVMSDYKLDVDTEFSMPEKSVFEKHPVKVPYNMNQLRFKHYGKNIELLISKAMEKDTPEDIEESVIYLGRLMKRFYMAWNKEIVEDELILQQLTMLSKGKLTLSLERIRSENLFNVKLGEPAKDNNKFNSLHVNYPNRELNTTPNRPSNSSNNAARKNNGKSGSSNNNHFKKKPR